MYQNFREIIFFKKIFFIVKIKEYLGIFIELAPAKHYFKKNLNIWHFSVGPATDL
jgi:hypothetical protein